MLGVVLVVFNDNDILVIDAHVAVGTLLLPRSHGAIWRLAFMRPDRLDGMHGSVQYSCWLRGAGVVYT